MNSGNEVNNSPGFPEMKAAAEEAISQIKSDPAASDMLAPSTAYTEDYASEVQQNMRAYRDMRWFAFFYIGVFGGLYLVFLLIALHGILVGNYFAGLLTKITESNWHALLVVSVALVVFAAVPLSLLMALVRMISDQKSDMTDLKFPSSEFVGACLNSARDALKR